VVRRLRYHAEHHLPARLYLDLFPCGATRPEATLGLLFRTVTLKLRHLAHEVRFGTTTWTLAGISMMMGVAMLLKLEDG
jgi:hypothetical protein